MTDEFWLEIKKRRNLFFIWWVCWIPFGIFYHAIESWLFGQQSPLPLLTPLLLWGLPWFYISLRICFLKCPYCAEKAFEHCFFFMKHARCQSCERAFEKPEIS